MKRAAWGLGTAVALVGCLDGAAPGLPDLDGALGVDDVLVWSTDVVFTDVRDLVVRDRTAWVLDRTEPFVTAISLDRSRPLRRFGARGDGPGELDRPVAIRASAEGVVVWDPGGGRVTRFDHAGRVRSTERLEAGSEGRVRADITDVTHVDPWRIRVLAGDVLHGRFPDGVRQAPDVAGGALVRTGLRLGAAEVVARYEDLVPLDGSASGVFAAMPLWDVCGEDIVLWDPRARNVRWMDRDGRTDRAASVDLPPARLGLDEAERYFRYMARHELGPAYESAGIDFAVHARTNLGAFGPASTTFADIRCDPGGSAWLQLFDPAADVLGRGPTWIAVHPERPTRVVRFDTAFRPILFTDDGAYGVQQTAIGEVFALWREAQATSE